MYIQALSELLCISKLPADKTWHHWTSLVLLAVQVVLAWLDVCIRILVLVSMVLKYHTSLESWMLSPSLYEMSHSFLLVCMFQF